MSDNYTPYKDNRNLGRSYYGRPQKADYSAFLSGFQKKWITEGADAECIRFCEEAAGYLVDQGMSSSYIRNIFGELKRIEARTFANCRADFYLLRPKVAYITARSDKDMTLFKEIYNRMADEVKDGPSFKNLVNMVEAIIAYHKAKGGK